MKRIAKRLLAALGAGILLLGAAGGIYIHDCYHAEPAAVEAAALNSADVQLERRALVFAPEETPSAGLLFYPGGKVQPEAYAPLLQACAERGILCVLLPMPGNLAVLDAHAADEAAQQVQALYPAVTDWYLGGHSLGGAMAASCAGKHGEHYRGLVLLAAYSTVDLTDSGLRVLSLYGSEDGVLDREAYEKYRPNLPDNCIEQVIGGGCHAGFGNYGAQKGDGVPSISAEEQQAVTAEAIAELILG